MDPLNKSDEQLVQDAGRVVIGTPSGLEAQQAQVEMMRRLKDVIEKSNKSADRFNFVATTLSIVMIFMALAQLIVSIFPPKNDAGRWTVYILLLIGLIGVTYLVIKKFSFNQESDK